jgi:hypothetical protein
VITSNLPKKGVPDLIAAIDDKNSRKLYKTLCLINHLLACIDGDVAWRTRLIELIERHAPDLFAMGFPANWRERKLWA